MNYNRKLLTSVTIYANVIIVVAVVVTPESSMVALKDTGFRPITSYIV